jgi:hypothetical protein
MDIVPTQTVDELSSVEGCSESAKSAKSLGVVNRLNDAVSAPALSFPYPTEQLLLPPSRRRIVIGVDPFNEDNPYRQMWITPENFQYVENALYLTKYFIPSYSNNPFTDESSPRP